MKYPKVREIREALISLFTAAYTTSFPSKPHIPYKNYRGKPVVDDEYCVGCETCAHVCPSGAIKFFDDKENKVRIVERNYGLCIFCGQCEEHCITGRGVKLSDTLYELATFDREQLIEKQSKELVLCEHCGAVITTRQHILFIHDKIGPLAFSSILNLNVINEQLKLADQSDVSTQITDDLKRKDMFQVLCPKCLRKTLLKFL